MGAVLDELEKAGLADNTLVVFMSDNGMAFPFAKANCYLNSTKTPFIARWPGHIAPGSHNESNYITGIDFTPTILEALGMEGRLETDGMSYLPLLCGKEQPEREDIIFTQFNLTSVFNSYPMRCVQTKDFGYIFNDWSDGKTALKNKAMTGLTFNAMKEAGKENEAIVGRCEFFIHRCPEEFYDFKNDPDGLHNLIDDPAYQEQIQWFREQLHDYMVKTKDPVLKEYHTQAYDDRIRACGEAFRKEVAQIRAEGKFLG